MSQYSVGNATVGNLVSNIEQGFLGLPDMQRPFVWSTAKARDLFDSMFQGFPVGVLTFWAASKNAKPIGAGAANPNELIIDGQQRLTSLYAVIKGKPVLNERKELISIVVAFNPLTATFESSSLERQQRSNWIENITEVYANSSKLYDYITKFLKRQGDISAEARDTISDNIQKLVNLLNYTFPIITLSSSMDAETASELFVRVNNQGTKLTQADFIFTLMSVYWQEGREALEGFCERARDANCKEYNHFIQPEADDLLRVNVALAFRRGRLRAAYKVLTGKDIKSNTSSPEIRDQQFDKLRKAQKVLLDAGTWNEFLKCIMVAGFRRSNEISSRMAVIAAYIFYLIGRQDFGIPTDALNRPLARWFFFITLTSRYSSGFEGKIEADLSALDSLHSRADFLNYLENVINTELTEDFWTNQLVQALNRGTTGVVPALSCYQSALVLLDAYALCSNIKLETLLDPTIKGHRATLEKHHLFPKDYVKNKLKLGIRLANQQANFALLDSDDHKSIGNKAPIDYFPELAGKFSNGSSWNEHMRLHALPPCWEKLDYRDFLHRRRQMMAQIIREGFAKLAPQDK